MSDDDLQGLLKRHRAFWDRESVDKPLLNVTTDVKDSLFAPLHGISIPLADGTILSEQGEPLTPDMIDPSLILHVEEYPLRLRESASEGPLTVGDLLVTRAPLGKMTWVEAVLGCKVIPRLDTGSIYSEPYLDGPEDLDKIPSLENNAWFELLKEYTRLLVEDSRGRYQVVQCLQRGPIDLASALLGHSEMCYAIHDQPKELHALNERCAETFIEVARAQQRQVPPLEGGFCNPFGVWSPGTVVRTQCDVASSVSPETYGEFFFPYDREICKAFDYSVVHLHSGYLHHIEVLLKDRYPNAIQVSLDTGSTPFTVRDLIPTFARVLEEKPLFIQGEMTRDEFNALLDALPPRGLYISPWAFDNE